MPDDLRQFADEIKRHFDVTAESLRSEIRHVAGGVISLGDAALRNAVLVRTPESVLNEDLGTVIATTSTIWRGTALPSEV